MPRGRRHLPLAEALRLYRRLGLQDLLLELCLLMLQLLLLLRQQLLLPRELRVVVSMRRVSQVSNADATTTPL